MTTRLITPPAALAVSLEAARASAKLDGTDSDAELQQAIRTYSDEAEHETGRALITQTWRVTLDEFPRAIRLPNAPLASVVHVKFYDATGQQQTLAPQDYQVDIVSEPGYIVPAPGKSWPATAARINAVEVQYIAGYGADHTSVPDAIKGYILAKVTAQFDQTGNASTEFLPRLLDRHRIYV
jgi:uncharacterized phiE125 gp8 family phage protein